MESQKISREQLRSLLIKNWMAHDGLWYGEVAAAYGMAEASPMNIRVCRKLGQVEFRRLMKMFEKPAPKNMTEYRELFDLGREAFFPDFVTVRVEYPGNDNQDFHFDDCFAHRAMMKTGLLPEYECGIFERVEGWFDAMGLSYTRSPDLSRCLKLEGGPCDITVQFRFETTKTSQDPKQAGP